jgi:hypothetical protein
MNRSVIVLLTISILTTGKLVGQKLVDFSYSKCSRYNPHIDKMNCTLNNMTANADSLNLYVTWVTSCSFDPEFPSMEIDSDTIYFRYNNKSDDALFCACVYQLNFKVSKIEKKDYQIKINNWAIDKNAKRYRTEGYIVEYFPVRSSNMKKLREIYSEKGKLLAEVYYDEQGNITSEKYYNETWGFLHKEMKY